MENGPFEDVFPGSTISTLLHDRINPKDCQVLSLGDTGFLQFFRVVSRDYGKPRFPITKSGYTSSIAMLVYQRVYEWNISPPKVVIIGLFI